MSTAEIVPDAGPRVRRAFGLFLFGQTVSAFGDAFSQVAMPLLVLAITGSVAQMGFVAGLSTACQLAAGFVAGPIVERFDRRLFMVVSDTLQMIFGGLIPIAWWIMPAPVWKHWSIWLIYCIVTLSSFLYTGYQVGLRSLMPQLVDRSALTHANSRLTLNTEISFGLGPAVAGLTIAFLGAPVAIGINALTFGVSALALAVLRLRPMEPGDAQDAAEPSRRRSGLGFLWRQKFLRELGLLEMANTLFVAGAVSLFIFYVRHDLRQSAVVVGLLLTLGSVGAVLGAVLAPRMRARFGLGPAWLVSLAIQGLALVAVSLSGSIWAVASLAVVFALGRISASVLSLSRRQELIPHSLLPRVTAAVITMTLAAQSIGTIGLTSAADHLPIRDVFVAAGIVTVVIAAVGTRSAVRADVSRAEGARIPAHKPLPRPVNLGIALAVTSALLAVCTTGLGPIPRLGAVFEPVTGVWGATARGAGTAQPQTLHLPLLHAPVRVDFDRAGVPTIYAADLHDAFLAQAYVTTRYRLFEMDLMRRQGGGTLAQVLGPEALSSDEIELTLGLGRTAQALYDSLPATDPSREAMNAYAAGVNAAIAEAEASHELPATMDLLGYQPAAWTPEDSLLIQGDITQSLDYTTTPLDNELLVRTLGLARTRAWFPVGAPTPQVPFDSGSYQRLPPAPIGVHIPGTAPTPATRNVPTAADAESPGSGRRNAAGTQPMATVAKSALSWLAALPSEVHRYAESNAWAVAGSRSSTGRPMLASDPHLQQTLPSIWYQIALNAPGLHVSGVSIPGVPGVLIGRTPDLAWGLTDTQNQSTFFYRETLDPRNHNYYLWHNAWHEVRFMHYRIAVKGAPTVPYTVRICAQGPLLNTDRQTTAVWWAGALPSRDLDALFRLYHATTGAQVRRALGGWLAPTENFVYATASGQIGIYSPGIYPLVRAGTQWLPLPGTGAYDVAGTIPQTAVPQVSNPPDGFVLSSNQRPVGGSYPYYIGTTAAFDPGYRALTVQHFLAAHPSISETDMEQLQGSQADGFAVAMVPYLLRALHAKASQLTGPQRSAEKLLSQWSDTMTEASAPAAIWWSFITNYIEATFGPWWRAKKVPSQTDEDLQLGPGLVSLDVDLQYWTAHDPANAAFSLPSGEKRTAAEVMVLAFDRAVSQLSRKFGGSPATWTWGRMHTQEITSLTDDAALSYGPRGAGGDMFTPDAADGYPISAFGPSWRMVISFAGGSVGVYPGGQSEDPASPWYQNMVSLWWNDRYLPLPPPADTAADTGGTAWTLRPGRDP